MAMALSSSNKIRNSLSNKYAICSPSINIKHQFHYRFLHYYVTMVDSTNVKSSGTPQEAGCPLVSSVRREVYKKHEKRGMAIIFNHKNYDIDIPARFGTDKDRDELSAALNDLGFIVKVYNNLSSAEITDVISRVKDIDHSDHDCLLVTVMSHGEDRKFYARDKPYLIKGLWEPFFNVPSLVGKPKVFFIQACRGDKMDPGITVNFNSDECDAQNQEEQKLYSIPITADILVMYSTFEGYYSYRHPQKGSYFIQSVVHQLKAAQDRNILSILTDVNREVALNYDDKEMCTIVSTLTRLFYLN